MYKNIFWRVYLKKRYVLGIIVLIIVLLLVFSPSSPSTQFYNGTTYSFNYPGNWNISWENNYSRGGSGITLRPVNGSKEANIIITDVYYGNSLNDAMNYFVDLYSHVYPNDFDDTLMSDPNYQMIYNKSLNVNGISGFDMLFKASESGNLKDPHVYVEIIMLQKGDKFYEIRLNYARNVTSPYAHDDLMTIVNSLKIK